MLYGEEGIFAFEVKNSNKIRSQDIRSLKEFSKDYPMCKTILLYRGDMRLMRNEVICIPCPDFLRALKPELSMQEILKAWKRIL